MYLDLATRIDKESLALGLLARETVGRPPILGIIQLGENPASSRYIKYKKLKIASFEWECRHICLPESSKEGEIQNVIAGLEVCDGIILQLPVPIPANKLTDYIPYTKDVDGINSINQGRLLKGYPEEEYIAPCTAQACIHILESIPVPLSGTRIALLGRSFLVGKPLQILLEQRGATVFSISRHDRDQASLSKECNVVISAIGSPGYITQEYIRHDAFVIDIGTTIVNGKIVGDVAPDVKAGHITPSTGGVGPLTVSCLMYNLAKCAKWRT